MENASKTPKKFVIRRQTFTREEAEEIAAEAFKKGVKAGLGISGKSDRDESLLKSGKEWFNKNY